MKFVSKTEINIALTGPDKLFPIFVRCSNVNPSVAAPATHVHIDHASVGEMSEVADKEVEEEGWM